MLVNEHWNVAGLRLLLLLLGYVLSASKVLIISAMNVGQGGVRM